MGISKMTPVLVLVSLAHCYFNNALMRERRTGHREWSYHTCFWIREGLRRARDLESFR